MDGGRRSVLPETAVLEANQFVRVGGGAEAELYARTIEWARDGMSVGVIPRGVDRGMLLAALIPSTRPERQAASTMREEAQPAVEELKQAGQEMAEGLKESAQSAASDLKDTNTPVLPQSKRLWPITRFFWA